jgi:hypothetical protein
MVRAAVFVFKSALSAIDSRRSHVAAALAFAQSTTHKPRLPATGILLSAWQRALSEFFYEYPQ